MRLRIALLHHELGASGERGVQDVRALASALRERDHEPVLISSHLAPPRRSVEGGIDVLRVPRLPEGLLRQRGFAGPLTHLPFALRALHHGRFDLAHAFSAPDAAVALRWRRSEGRPVVFACGERLDRSSLADRRLRLRLLSSAVEESDAVIVPTEAAHRGLERWMATGGHRLAPDDGGAHERLYRSLLASGRADDVRGPQRGVVASAGKPDRA